MRRKKIRGDLLLMNISIICVGKLKEKYLKEAIDEYSKRLSKFASLEITEIPDQKIPDKSNDKIDAQILEKEGTQILSKIKQDSFVIAMCIEGNLISSEDLANKLSDITMTKSHITFIIGGSLGLSDEVKKRADFKMSFGRITLPHQLMRVVLAEQIYRAFKINANESYHK